MSAIREYVMDHALFCHHDHHADFKEFDANREDYSFRSLLGYAEADLFTAKGERPRDQEGVEEEEIAELWPLIRATGYGRAVSLGCQELLGLEYEPANFELITDALQSLIEDKSAHEVYSLLVHEKAQNTWTLQDGRFRVENENAFKQGLFPSTYRFAFRMAPLFSVVSLYCVAKDKRIGR